MKTMVPNYNDNELKLNSYKMYYKTYSYWSSKCQSVYKSSEAAMQGQYIGDVAALSFPLFLGTVAFYGVVFIG